MSFPVELLSLSEQNRVRLRATVSEFGPVLFSQILDASNVQAGIISVLFKYCDDHQLPLLDLKDFKKYCFLPIMKVAQRLRRSMAAFPLLPRGRSCGKSLNWNSRAQMFSLAKNPLTCKILNVWMIMAMEP